MQSKFKWFFVALLNALSIDNKGKATVLRNEGHQMHAQIFPLHEQHESDLIKIRLRDDVDERWHYL